MTSSKQQIAQARKHVQIRQFAFSNEGVGAVKEDINSRLQNWPVYEADTISQQINGRYGRLRWYAVLLVQWMGGKGLRQIIDSSINYKLKNGGSVRIAWEEHQFDGSRLHRNATYNEVLDAIENIILFRLSNYFLQFSNDFKRKTGADQFPNDWYEYIEYGTDNPTTIGLQRLGFSRVPAHPRRPRLLHRQRHQPGVSQPTYPQLRKLRSTHGGKGNPIQRSRVHAPCRITVICPLPWRPAVRLVRSKVADLSKGDALIKEGVVHVDLLGAE